MEICPWNAKFFRFIYRCTHDVVNMSCALPSQPSTHNSCCTVKSPWIFAGMIASFLIVHNAINFSQIFTWGSHNGCRNTNSKYREKLGGDVSRSLVGHFGRPVYDRGIFFRHISKRKFDLYFALYSIFRKGVFIICRNGSTDMVPELQSN